MKHSSEWWEGFWKWLVWEFQTASLPDLKAKWIKKKKAEYEEKHNDT